VYDAGVTATVSVLSATFTGKVAGDVLTVSSTGVFGDKNVGTGKTVTLTNTLGGADLANYSITDQATTTASITARPLTITAATDSRVYNGTTSSVGVPTITAGALQGTDTASWTETFDTKNVGTNKTLTPAGVVTDGNSGMNYSYTYVTNATGVVTQKSATLSGITASDKVYDAGVTATVSVLGATFTGKVAGDVLTVSSTGVFGDKNVGTGKTVTLTNTLGGADLANYSITDQATTTASITPCELTVGGSFTATNKVYDGNVNATIDINALTLITVIGADDVTLNAMAVFANKNVGNNKTVSLIGSSLAGTDAANYSLSLVGAPTTTANITAAGITLTVGGTFTANNKTYDSLTAATINSNSLTLIGVVGGDIVTLTPVLAFADKNVGTGITVALTEDSSLGGAQAGNYSLSLVGAPTTTANITARPLTITAATDTKVYNGTTSSVAVPTITSGALQGSDTATWTETFDNKNVGTGKILTPAGLVTDGNAGNNYSYTYVTNATGVVTAKALTVSNVNASNKVYDAGTVASLNLGTAAFVGVIGGDTVNIDTSSATGTFGDKNVGAGKMVTVSGIAKTGG
jgi:hypothetical protein